MPPFQRKSATSREAAYAIAPHAPTQAERVYEYVLSCGSEGATREEIALALHIKESASTGRVAELMEQELLAATGRKRPTVTGHNAYIVVAKPKQAVLL
jgi:hypothetical protein